MLGSKQSALPVSLLIIALAVGVGLIVVLLDTMTAEWVYMVPLGLMVVIVTVWSLWRFPIAPYLIFPLSVLELMYVTVAGVNVRPHQIVTLLAIVALVLRGKVVMPRGLVDWACVIYLLVNGISILYSYSRIESIEMWLLYAMQIGTLYASQKFLDTPSRVQKFLPFFLSSGFVLTAVGLIQIILIAVGILPPYRDAWMIPTGRPPGTFVEAAWLAAFSLFFLIVYIPYLYSKRFSRYRIIVITAWLLMLVTNLFCMARAAWLGLLAGILLQLSLMLWLRPKGGRGLLNLIACRLLPMFMALGLLAVLIVPNLADSFIHRFLDLGNRSESAASLRIDDFRDVMKLVYKRPWTGYGIGTLETLMQDPVNNPRHRGFVNVALNVYLTMLFDAGIPGMLAGLLVTLSIPWEILRNAATASDPVDRDLLIALSVGMIALVLTFQFSNGFPRGWYWAIAGISLAISRVKAKRSVEEVDMLEKLRGLGYVE